LICREGPSRQELIVTKRIESLSAALFGKKPDALIRSLRYQLVYSTAATLIEAAASKADEAVFLVQEFYSPSLSGVKLQQNRADWSAFVRAFPELTIAAVEKNQILGPISVPGGGRVPNYVPLYLGSFVSMCPDLPADKCSHSSSHGDPHGRNS
jgi:hypothetical protein